MHGDDHMLSDLRATTDEGLVTARPPREFVAVARWDLRAFDEVAALRRELLAWVARTGATAPAESLGTVADNMVMVASELATNALRHGRPPTVVQLLRHEDSLILDVADHDPSTAPVIAGRRPAGEGGYGLVIARRLAQEVGWYVTPPTKHVWAAFSAQA